MHFSSRDILINDSLLKSSEFWQHTYISIVTYKPSKPGQTDRVFGLLAELISRFVHAGLHVSRVSSNEVVNLVKLPQAR